MINTGQKRLQRRYGLLVKIGLFAAPAAAALSACKIPRERDRALEFVYQMNDTIGPQTSVRPAGPICERACVCVFACVGHGPWTGCHGVCGARHRPMLRVLTHVKLHCIVFLWDAAARVEHCTGLLHLCERPVKVHWHSHSGHNRTVATMISSAARTHKALGSRENSMYAHSVGLFASAYNCFTTIRRRECKLLKHQIT